MRTVPLASDTGMSKAEYLYGCSGRRLVEATDPNINTHVIPPVTKMRRTFAFMSVSINLLGNPKEKPLLHFRRCHNDLSLVPVGWWATLPYALSSPSRCWRSDWAGIG